MLDGIRKTLKEGVVVLGGVKDGKVALLVNFAPEAVKRGGHAGNLLKELAPMVGGKGGGKAGDGARRRHGRGQAARGAGGRAGYAGEDAAKVKSTMGRATPTRELATKKHRKHKII